MFLLWTSILLFKKTNRPLLAIKKKTVLRDLSTAFLLFHLVSVVFCLWRELDLISFHTS